MAKSWLAPSQSAAHTFLVPYCSGLYSVNSASQLLISKTCGRHGNTALVPAVHLHSTNDRIHTNNCAVSLQHLLLAGRVKVLVHRDGSWYCSSLKFWPWNFSVCTFCYISLNWIYNSLQIQFCTFSIGEGKWRCAPQCREGRDGEIE